MPVASRKNDRIFSAKASSLAISEAIISAHAGNIEKHVLTA
jgi:hypothetical protein